MLAGTAAGRWWAPLPRSGARFGSSFPAVAGEGQKGGASPERRLSMNAFPRTRTRAVLLHVHALAAARVRVRVRARLTPPGERERRCSGSDSASVAESMGLRPTTASAAAAISSPQPASTEAPANTSSSRWRLRRPARRRRWRAGLRAGGAGSSHRPRARGPAGRRVGAAHSGHLPAAYWEQPFFLCGADRFQVWRLDCWVVTAHSFDDTHFRIAAQPLPFSEAILAETEALLRSACR